MVLHLVGDCGPENTKVRDFQLYLRRDIRGGVGYISGASTANQRIESWWGQLRNGCIDFWIKILNDLHERGLHSHSAMDKAITQYCFARLIQEDIDRLTWNSHFIRLSRNAAVPHGRPDILYSLTDATNYGHQIHQADIQHLSVDATFRSDMPCDEEIQTSTCDCTSVHQYIRMTSVFL